MSMDMQKQNASAKSIQLALKGTYEYFKVVVNASLPHASINRLAHTEKTGQNYKTLRMTLSRMVEAGLIAHPFRGMYTTLERDAESKKTTSAISGELLRSEQLEQQHSICFFVL